MDWSSLLSVATGSEVQAKLAGMRVPEWVGPAAMHAVELAEIAGGDGKAKKKRAKDALKAIGRVIDIPGIPQPLEVLIETVVIEAAVELAWGTKMGSASREARKAKRAAKRAARAARKA